MEVTGGGEVLFDSRQGACETAITSLEGSQRLNVVTLTFRALGRNHIALSLYLQPSQCYVLIKQSDSPCPYQFLSVVNAR